MPAPTCRCSDARACMSLGMHAIWQAHPRDIQPSRRAGTKARRSTRPDQTDPAENAIARVAHTHQDPRYCRLTKQVALFLGRPRAASAYPGPPETGASELHSVTPLLERTGVPLTEALGFAYDATSTDDAPRLPCLHSLLTRGTSVVRMHGPGCSRSSPYGAVLPRLWCLQSLCFWRGGTVQHEV
jgi:hypothetical protein